MYDENIILDDNGHILHVTADSHQLAIFLSHHPSLLHPQPARIKRGQEVSRSQSVSLNNRNTSKMTSSSLLSTTAAHLQHHATSSSLSSSSSTLKTKTKSFLLALLLLPKGQALSSSQTWANNVGTSALRNVENLALTVSRANDAEQTPNNQITDEESLMIPIIKLRQRNTGNTGALYDSTSEKNLDLISTYTKSQNKKVVRSALESLERDMQLLDNITAEKPQLSQLEITILSLSVALAGSGPIFFNDGYKIAEVLAPACAALSAAIGIGAEYTGKVAVADGKEVAANTLQCAAEAEALLAKAERVKAVSPLCVGISATAATLSLVAPVVLESIRVASNSSQLVAELYLLSPLVAVLAAAVASLSLQETRQFTSKAISTGNRRFAKGGLVGRTWLSASEQIEQSSIKTTQRWKSFAFSVLPAPIVGSLIPGELSTKAVIVAALAAAQSAFFLAQAENVLARGTDAVALKSRSAAVCDTYANQGARSAAILPFTSALSSLCAAGTAAIVELPWLESLGAVGGARGVISSVALVTFFPALSSLFAAAASVSKARCEVDAEAAIQTASTLALEYDEDDDPILRPFRGVLELIRLTFTTSFKSFKMSRFSRNVVQPVLLGINRIIGWKNKRGKN